MVDDRTALMSARALSPGYEVLWYTIDRVLGQGGFGITYLAHDRNLDRAVAIKEYLPTSFAYRHKDFSVKPMTGDHRENFAWGLGSFLNEAQTLARFNHPNIVRVHSVFEENNTAYMVMEYEHGQSLAECYKANKGLDQSFFKNVFFPIIDGLKDIHKFEFIHRDIKPANIYIREDGTPVLIDFGSARQTTQQQTSEMTTLVSQGYTPLEQYSANYGDQGPWTDIYAMAATIYEGVVGKKPEESLSRSACLMRSKPDPLEQLDARVSPGFDQKFLNAVTAGLKLEPEGRPQSLEDWLHSFDYTDINLKSVEPVSVSDELDLDQTRIQPRRRAREFATRDFDSFSDLELAQPRNARRDSHRVATSQGDLSVESPWDDSSVATNDDAFSNSNQFRGNSSSVSAEDLNKVETDSIAHSERSSSSSRHEYSRQRRGSAKRRAGWVLTMMTTIVLLGIGGVFYYHQSGTMQTNISVATLNNMPQPTQPIITELPAEKALEQLDEMASLAQLMTQAYGLSSTNPELLDAIRTTESSLFTLATRWNATKHAEIADRIREVSKALPVDVHDQTRIQGILSASSQVSGYTKVLTLLDNEQYLHPVGDSVLDTITTVSANDYLRLKSSDQWKNMMSAFSRTALDKLGRSEFEDVASLTDAVLTLDAQDPGFNALKSFLAGS